MEWRVEWIERVEGRVEWVEWRVEWIEWGVESRIEWNSVGRYQNHQICTGRVVGSAVAIAKAIPSKSQMDFSGAFSGSRTSLGLPELLNQRHGLPLQAALHPPSSARADDGQ